MPCHAIFSHFREAFIRAKEKVYGLMLAYSMHVSFRNNSNIHVFHAFNLLSDFLINTLGSLVNCSHPTHRSCTCPKVFPMQACVVSCTCRFYINNAEAAQSFIQIVDQTHSQYTCRLHPGMQPLLLKLQRWLPIKHRIRFKLALVVYKTVILQGYENI